MTRKRRRSFPSGASSITKLGFRCYRLVKDLDAAIYPIELMATPNRMGAFLDNRAPTRRAA
jgi:hypothetical protein